MPRRNANTRRRSQPRPPDSPAEQDNTDRLAAQLVSRGLASPRILGPRKYDRPRTTDERNAE